MFSCARVKQEESNQSVLFLFLFFVFFFFVFCFLFLVFGGFLVFFWGSMFLVWVWFLEGFQVLGLRFLGGLGVFSFLSF